MLNKQTIEVPAKTIEQVASVTCDWCKCGYPAAKTTPEETAINWNGKGRPHIEQVTGVFIQFSQSDPDGGGELVETVYHICPACFGQRLEPWLVSQGVQPNKRELTF